MVNDIRRFALMYEPTRAPEVSTDPDDDYPLALAAISRADYLVTGDKGHLLRLGHHASARILTARDLVALLRGT
jgi:predicted nucleic acid-binding protein